MRRGSNGQSGIKRHCNVVIRFKHTPGAVGKLARTAPRLGFGFEFIRCALQKNQCPIESVLIFYIAPAES